MKRLSIPLYASAFFKAGWRTVLSLAASVVFAVAANGAAPSAPLGSAAAVSIPESSDTDSVSGPFPPLKASTFLRNDDPLPASPPLMMVPGQLLNVMLASNETTDGLASTASGPAPTATENEVPVKNSAPSAPALPPSDPSAVPPSPPALLTSAAPASAPATASSGQPPKSTNAMVDLVNLLVDQGIIKKDKGEALIKKAETEAAEAQVSQVPAPAVATATTTGAPATGSVAAVADQDVDVDYVPKPVEDKIRSDIKQDVLDQAREENWAAPRQFPGWLNRISLFGDFRARFEADLFPDDNLQPGVPNPFINFNAINTAAPVNFSANGSPLLPTYNVNEDRDRPRIRARFGANSDLGDGFMVGFRIGSGSDDSPVTENQTLGAASGQGGNFSKYSVWIDRAFLKKEWGGNPTDRYDASITVGRFDNPFFHTSMIWADDLGFDGIAFQGKYQVIDGVTPFVTAGAFPVFNTDLNFGTSSTPSGEAYGSEDKYLLGAQVGTTWKINEDFSVKVAAAYYDFEDIQGDVSSAIDLSNGSPSPFTIPGYSGDTDDSRPAFAQFGNTYIPLRDYVNSGFATNNPAGYFQYYGLATAFREVALTGQLDYNRFDPFHISLVGEMVKNVAFDRGAILSNGPDFGSGTPTGPINNLNADGSYAGGDLGGYVRLNLGKVALEKLWDWNVNVGYRYVESDATVDGFADSDFGGYINGTNLQGYTLGGNLAFSPFVWGSVRYMSADTIAGPQLKDDTVQVDVNAKF